MDTHENNHSILNILTSHEFSKILEVILQPYKDRISALEKSYAEQSSKITALENRLKSQETMAQTQNNTKNNSKNATYIGLEEVKQIEMKQKYQNLILQGLPEEENENLQIRMAQILQEKFATTAQIDCRRIGKKSTTAQENEGKQNIRPVLISFNNIWKRRDIYRQRVQSLKNTGLFLCEDLPREQMSLAYLAREIKRKGKINSTWTQDWKIMVKDTPTSPPREITASDPLITNTTPTENNTQEIHTKTENLNNTENNHGN